MFFETNQKVFILYELFNIQRNEKSSAAPAGKGVEQVYEHSDPTMTREETAEEVEENVDDSVPFYESYWAQNTTAHGVSRVANTHKFHRVVWILALLGKPTYLPAVELLIKVEQHIIYNIN